MEMFRLNGGSQLKTRKFLQGLMMVVLLGSSAAALRAQDYRVFVEGGGSTIYDKRYYNAYGVSYGSTYKTSNSFAVGAEIPVRRLLSVEGSYGISRNNLAITNFYNSAVPHNETGYGIKNQRISIDAVAHGAKSFKGLRPYLVLGIEADRFAPTSAGAATATSPGFNGVPNTVLKPQFQFGYNFGGGVDISLTHFLAFRLDARDHRVRTPTYGLPSAATSTFTAYYPVGGHMNNIVYSAGFVFHFGG